MIKFFRKIRQKLLSENRLSKYLIYALGEIILVVAGILIALGVSNWNEQRKLDKRVAILLPKLKHQIATNLERTEGDLEGVVHFYKNSKKIANSIILNDAKLMDKKKLDSLILFTGTDFYINLDLITLIEAKENEDLSLIKSDDLRTALYTLIKVNEDVHQREVIINDDLKNHLKPYLNKHFNLKNLFSSLGYIGLEESKVYKNDNNKILEDQEFENIIVTRIMYLEDLEALYSDLKEVLEAVDSLLDKEINALGL